MSIKTGITIFGKLCFSMKLMKSVVSLRNELFYCAIYVWLTKVTQIFQNNKNMSQRISNFQITAMCVMQA